MSSDLEREFEEYAALMKLAQGEEMTGSEITAAIAALKNGIDTVKTLADVTDKAKSAELIRTISGMNLELSKLECELAEKNRRILELEKENEELKSSQVKLINEGGLYYTEDGDGPFCTGCYDNNQKVIRLSEARNRILGRYRCPVCNAGYAGNRPQNADRQINDKVSR